MKLRSMLLLFLILCSSLVFASVKPGDYQIITRNEEGQFSFFTESDFPVIVVNESDKPNLEIFFDGKKLESFNDLYESNVTDDPVIKEKMKSAFGIAEYISKMVDVKVTNDGEEIYSADWFIKKKKFTDNSIISSIIKVFLIISIIQCILYVLFTFLGRMKPWKLVIAIIQVIILLVLYL